MLLMDSMLAPQQTTTVVFVSTSHLLNVSASPTHGAYILAIAKSLPYRSTTILLAVADLLQQLGRAIPTTTTAKLKHLNAIWQLTTIMAGQPNAPPPDPTSPRVVPATPPRVAGVAFQGWPRCLTPSRHQTPSDSCPPCTNG